MRSELAQLLCFVACVYASNLSADIIAPFYRELGCVPEEGNNSCAFDCSGVIPAPEDKCLYRGMQYDIDQDLPDDVVEEVCAFGCVCSLQSDKPTWTCAEVDCPIVDLERGCFYQFDLDNCCPVSSACINETKTCDVNGEIYYEGQFVLSPDDPCLTCICDKQYDGSLDSLNCRKTACSVFRSLNSVHEKCAAVFLYDRCCPVDYYCSTGNETVVPGTDPTEICAGNTCEFGDMHLEVGDSLQVNHPCLQCECSTPPLVTCRRLTEGSC